MTVPWLDDAIAQARANTIKNLKYQPDYLGHITFEAKLPDGTFKPTSFQKTKAFLPQYEDLDDYRKLANASGRRVNRYWAAMVNGHWVQPSLPLHIKVTLEQVTIFGFRTEWEMKEAVEIMRGVLVEIRWPL